MFKPWAILDPILSIGFTLFILFNVFRNLKETLMLFLQATPDEEQMSKIRNDLLANDKVSDLHHFHIWSLDGERNVMTVHLVLKGEVSVEHIQSLKESIQSSLAKYHFEHTTVELEFADEQCRDEVK
jgi:cobalt-zinc-cadmium efflux system protein